MNIPSSFTRPVHLSLGAYGRCPHHVAIAHALTQSPSDPLLGNLSTTKLQLCPQNQGRIDCDMALKLRRNHPNIEGSMKTLLSKQISYSGGTRRHHEINLKSC